MLVCINYRSDCITARSGRVSNMLPSAENMFNPIQEGSAKMEKFSHSLLLTLINLYSKPRQLIVSEMEKYQFPNLANADPCLARSSLFKSLTFSSFLVIIPRPNTIIPILRCIPHPNRNVSQSQ